MTIHCKECNSGLGFTIKSTPTKVQYLCKKCGALCYELERNNGW